MLPMLSRGPLSEENLMLGKDEVWSCSALLIYTYVLISRVT